jgi:hypothetical protein
MSFTTLLHSCGGKVHTSTRVPHSRLRIRTFHRTIRQAQAVPLIPHLTLPHMKALCANGGVIGKVILDWDLNEIDDQREFKRPTVNSRERMATRWTNPATNAREDRANRKETSSRIGHYEGEKLTFTFLNKAGNPSEKFDVP